jgi:flagellar assembly protein FliH
LSNLIKSERVISLDDLKKLELIRKFEPVPQNNLDSDPYGKGNFSIDVETQSLKERIIQDAEQTAELLLKQAREEAQEIRASARSESDAWWQSRRDDDARTSEEANLSGFEEGYQAGSSQADQAVRQQWEDTLAEAQAIVQQAYVAKERTISEAESFLVSLSCSIAEKIVARQIAESPETALKMFAQALARRKEQGVITLCVSPGQFAHVQTAKDELALSLDSQADLQIVPDPSIEDGGCVIRSSFGTIDARIDTQLTSIREELLRVAAFAAEEESRHAAP